MHFVDQINFVTAFGRRVTHVIAQLADVFHAVIACTVDLDDVETVTTSDLATIVADAARSHRRPLFTIERFRQDSCGRCFPDAARSDEQIGVCEPVLLNRILERARHMGLADQIVECLGAIFAREDLVGHALNLTRCHTDRKYKISLNVHSMLILRAVIPSRADGEGPHTEWLAYPRRLRDPAPDERSLVPLGMTSF